MNRLLLAAGCLVALNVSAAQARTFVFLGKSVDDWRNELRSPKAPVRRSAAFALGRMGVDARAAVPALARRLQEDADDGVRDMAASAIGDIARAVKDDGAEVWRQSGGALFRSLKQDKSERVRRSAAYALGSFGPPAAGAAESLIQALSDENASVRQNAAWALGQIGAGAAVPSLCARLSDKDPLVRRDAAGALGSMGKAGEKAGRPLIELVKRESDAVVKITALDSLARIAGPQDADAAKDLEPLLEEKDPEIRLDSAIVLARIGGEQAVRALPVLRAGLKHVDPDKQKLVTAALGNLGPDAKPAMHDLADTLSNEKNTVEVRSLAALAIAHIGSEAKPVVPALVKALQRGQPTEVRQFVAEALAKMEYPANEKAIPAILAALENDNDPLVRQRCVWSLFELRSPRTFQRLGVDKALEKLLDEKGELMALVRFDAARKLAAMFGPDAPDKTVDVLLEMLGNRTLAVYNGTDAKVEGAGNEAAAGRANVQQNLGGDARFMAVKALDWLGAKTKRRPEAVEAIRKAAKSDNDKLRKTAEEALMKLGLDK